jgi:hypothetical protein
MNRINNLKFHALHSTAVGLMLFVFHASASVFYVNVSNNVPASPFITWGTAATNIQNAVDVSTDGDLILVSNGVYKAGGELVYGSLSNRVVINKAVTVQSINGPTKTFIQGNAVLGNNAVRCVYMTNNAALLGFTLTNGATQTTGDSYEAQSGGGIWCESASAIASNCVVANCTAFFLGGGTISGTLMNCTLTNNTAVSRGGGALAGILTNCLIVHNTAGFGGGVCSNLLFNCKLTTNRATSSGGGAFSCILSNCVLSGNSATNGGGAVYGTLTGCTLSNNTAYNGGGVSSNVLNNCWLANNVATNNGGGAFYGNLAGCTISNNGASYGGGSFFANLTNSTLIQNFASYGGGSAWGTGSGCRFTNNFASDFGGGVFSNLLFNCMLSSNIAGPSSGGGGSYGGTLNGCWITWSRGGGSYNDILNNCFIKFTLTGEGANSSTLINCTVVDNSFLGVFGTENCHATNSIIYDNFEGNNVDSSLSYCCTTPLPPGPGNFTNAPLFLDTVHQQSNSPCVDAGNNSFVAGSVDIDGRPRIVDGTVDVGAAEFQGASLEPFIVWLYQYGLPDDGSADYADSDGTGMNNWQKWIAGLNPINPASVLKLSSPSKSVSGVTVTWQSVTNVTYYLQSSTNLSAQPAFSSIQSNLVGQTGSTSYTDTTATNGSSYFYRIGVQ